MERVWGWLTSGTTIKANPHSSSLTLQVVEAGRLLSQEGSSMSINNIVFMGMGEPLHNYDPVIAAIDIMAEGLELSRSKIIVSSVGAVDGEGWELESRGFVLGSCWERSRIRRSLPHLSSIPFMPSGWPRAPDKGLPVHRQGQACNITPCHYGRGEGGRGSTQNLS